MNAPGTLLELAGAPRAVARWSGAALLLIDAQEEYASGALPLAGFGAAVDDCARLLAAARRRGAPVIHVVHHGRPGGALFDPGGPFAEIVSGLAPAPDEPVVVKSLPNGFARTNLDALLRSLGRRELIVAGFATHMCVSATVRAALDLGYTSTVVASACATRDLPGPFGGTLPAAQVHEVALAELADRYASVVAAPDALEAAPDDRP